MTLPLQSTLAELTSELLTLIGQGGTGVANASMSARAEAAIRRAQITVNNEAGWTINRVRSSVALLAGETTFDWPDDTIPGDILRVSAVRDSDPNYEWDLVAGISSEDRTSWNFGGFSTVQDVPYKYDFHDGTVEVGPESSGDTTIYLLYLLGPAALVSPGDRPNCDAEAVLLKSEVLLRNALGGTYREAIPACEAAYLRYLAMTKAKQSIPSTVIPGGQWGAEDMARRSWRTRDQRHWAFRDRRP